MINKNVTNIFYQIRNTDQSFVINFICVIYNYIYIYENSLICKYPQICFYIFIYEKPLKRVYKANYSKSDCWW